MLVLSFTMRILGVEPYLTANGLNLGSLLIFAAVMGFGGSFISLAISKWMAKKSMGVRVIETPSNSTEFWLMETIRKYSADAGIKMPEVGIYDAPDVNAFWENQSFHNYADYAMGGSFRSGFARLRELGSIRRCAVMCAEAVWWRCHRRIIADYLLVAGERVFHILGPKVVSPASLTKGATLMPDGVLTYPAQMAKASNIDGSMSQP